MTGDLIKVACVCFSDLQVPTEGLCPSVGCTRARWDPGHPLKSAKKPMYRIICKLLSKTQQTGEIPRRFEMSPIIPIHKGGPQSTPSNIRPISLTSHLVKTIERVRRLILVKFLQLLNKLDPRQHGSRARRNTLSHLLQYQDSILEALENEDNLDSVYLDFAKASNKVDHGILLHTIKMIEITGKIGRWVLNFLTGKEQKVLLRSRKSQMFLLVLGVHQGSVLCPLLFLIFIRDISEGLSAIVLIYLCDSKVHKIIKSKKILKNLQNDLDNVVKWEEISIKENTMYFTSEMQDEIHQVDHCKDIGIAI